jgi:hypothetical protein
MMPLKSGRFSSIFYIAQLASSQKKSGIIADGKSAFFEQAEAAVIVLVAQ